MRIYDRTIGTLWLQKFTTFAPLNIKEDPSIYKGIKQWGNYTIGYNIYPNLFDVIVRYSPLAKELIRKRIKLTFGNIPKEIKTQLVGGDDDFKNTLNSLIRNCAYDYFVFQGSFAIWVGYDGFGRINQMMPIALETIRYIDRDEDKFPATDKKYMICSLNEDNGVGQIFYPYEPERAREQLSYYSELQKTKEENNIELTQEDLYPGQILFYNTAYGQLYPDSTFDASIPLLLTDAGLDTGIISLLGNGDLCRTYKKQFGTTGTDTVNNGDYYTLGTIWCERENQNLAAVPNVGSEYYTTGVKNMGGNESLNIVTEEAITNYVKTNDFPKVADEIAKLDERTARKLCLDLEIPYEYAFKMDSGILNQDNRATIFKELNALYDDDRVVMENVLNHIVSHSIWSWKVEIRPIGEGQEDVKKANENVTE